jgi:hypothetical protein
MQLRIALAASLAAMTIAGLAGSASHALQSADSLSWTRTAYQTEAMQIRWRLATENGHTDILRTNDESRSDMFEASRIAGQVDFYPFGDEFYLSAGAVRSLDQDSTPDWMQIQSSPAWSSFPHGNLVDQSAEAQLGELTRYFGAGLTVREVNAWSLTVEGGAYFRDRAKDRLHVAGFNALEGATLLDNLDRVERAAVGETQARGIKPVGHLVIRRRF